MPPRKPKASPEDKLRDQLAAARATLQTQEQVIAAQQSEIEQMREMVREVAAPKPGRPFRTRKLIHGPLNVTIKGVDVTEDEVVIEHVGGFLAVRIGDAIGAAAGGQQREAYRFSPDVQQPVPFAAPAAAPPVVEPRHPNDVRTTANDVWAASIAANDASNMAGVDPSVVNAALAPQADPRMPGGYQVHDVERSIAATGFGGWSGVGPRPKGWQDPHAKPDPAN